MGDGLTTSTAAADARRSGSGSGSDSGAPIALSGIHTLGAPRWHGKTVGRFKLLEAIGHGSIGKVFRAEDVQLHRHVALKIIRTRGKDLTQANRAERLVAEARAAAKLQHPHVVNVYDIGNAPGLSYIAMELVEGGCLQTLVERGGRLDVGRACRLICEAAAALQYAHDNGIVHRDVKPCNLMLTREGRCKLADFGLACEIDPEPREDDDGEHPSVGTPMYIAPEVIRSQAASPRSDIYSLGGTLWFLLTGQSPFPREMTALIIAAHLLDPLPDLRTLRPDAPAGLAQVLTKALAKDPAERYATAEEFAAALRPFAAAPAGEAGKQPAHPAAPLPPRRWHPTLVVGLVAIAVAMLAAAVVAVVIARRLQSAPAARPSSATPPVTWSPAPESTPTPPDPAVAASASERGGRPQRTERANVLPAGDAAALLRIADGKDRRSPRGADVTVEGVVTATTAGPAGRYFRIHFGPQDQEGAFVAAYEPPLVEAMQSRFPSPPGTAMLGLVGKRVRITGKVERDNDRPRVLIHSPDQVRVVE